ncbi:MAG: hypothetical protein H7245_08405 [Candidatus Saccharibacteria bacterium]|nr:hypothetical protein [Pseudorhodobacter sp.]
MLQAPSDRDRAPTAPTLPSRVLAADQAAPQNLPVGPFDPAIMPRVQPAFSAAGMQSGASLVARPLPDQAPALPGLAPIPAADRYQVNLHVTPRNSGGDVVAQLRDLGLTNTTSVVHDLAMAQTTIAFYHARDATAAQQMATLLNGEIMDMTGLQPAPRVGTVDIYLKD